MTGFTARATSTIKGRRKRKARTRLGLSLALALTFVGAVIMFAAPGGATAASVPSPTGATITSDKADYPPGANVTLTGAGWGVGESVQIHVNDDANQVWHYDGTAVAGLNGSFTSNFQLPNVFIANYSVTATGTTSGTATTTFTDANPSANIDQCDPPTPYNALTYDCARSGATGWVNGNNDGIYFEGDSVAYRLAMDNLPLTSHTVKIEWDTTKGGTHALDYITSVDRTLKAANPCAGVSGCSGPPNTFPIPADPQVTGAGVTQAAGNFSLYGGTITAVSAYSYPLGSGFSGDKSAQIAITFTASVANPVLAWGGHIASRQDWGPNNSAVAISGSPYHTRLIDLDGSGGNQDRSLSADAVIFPGSITVIKDAIPDSSQSFSFTGSPSPLTNFSLVDDGTSTNTKLFGNITNFQTYTVNETPIPSGWAFDSSSCSVSSPNGGSYTTSGTPPTTTAIGMAEGENWTCTYVNKKNATLTIKKVTDPVDSGSSTFGFTASGSGTSSFTLDTNSSDATNSDTKVFTFSGGQLGSKSVTEGSTTGWSLTDVTCVGATNSGSGATATVNVTAGADITCTYTNKKDATLTIKKVTDPANSGSDTFGFTASGSGTSSFTLDTNGADSTNSDTKVFTFNASQLGSKSVTEGSTTGWSLTDVTCVGATNSGSGATATVNVTAGANITCTYTNKKDATLTIKKVTDPADSGSSTFGFTASGSGTSSFTLDTNSSDATNSDTKVFTFNGSQLGSKSVTEGSTTGWSLTDITCVGGTNTGTSPTATVNVTAGANITCTYTNKKDAKLTIKKVTDPVDSGSSTFGFTASGSGTSSFTLDTNSGDATNSDTKVFTFPASQLGSKSVTEGSTTGWSLTDVTCVGASNSGSGATATVTVTAGADITCTYTNKKDAKLTIKKVTDPVDSGSSTFGFTASGSGTSSFTLDTNSGDATNSDTKVFTFPASQFGSKSITEGSTTGWSLTDITCVGGTNTGTSPTATVTLAAGDDVTCTYTNKKDAKLTIKKVTDPGNSGSDTFGFTASGSGTSSFTLDTNSGDATNSDTKVFTFPASQFGSKSVTEGSTTGWSLTDITCVGGTNTGTSPTATVNVTAGADITCTYTNKKDAKLTIKKVTDPANSGLDSFPFTSASTGVDSSFSLDTNGADATYPSQKTFTFSGTGYGSKSVTEGSTTGWTLTNVDCGSATNSGSGATATVTVNPGDDITCTYTNTKGASLTIKKVTDPGNSGADTFGFTASGSGTSSFTLDTNSGDPTNSDTKVFAFDGSQLGSKSVTEGSTTGWSLTDVTCVGATNSGSGATATVDITAGAQVTCTYTNKKDAKLTIKKVTDPANSGTDTFPFTSASTGVDSSFTLDTNGADPTNPSQKTFTFSGSGYGSKSVTEGSTTGWSLTDVTCVGATNAGSGATATVTVNPGDDITCTYTNKKDAKLTIKKVTDPGNSGSDSFGFTASGSGTSSFTLDTNGADATNSDTKVFTFSASQLGSKSVTEGSTTGWSLTDITCVGGTNTGTSPTATVNVTAGANITCTYTNKKDAKLTIKKVTDPGNSGTDTFPFTSASTGVDASFTLDTNGADATNPDQKVFTFSAGQYGAKTVTEGSTTGWSLTNISCVGGTNTGSSPSATVTVAAGDNVTCTFTNKKDATLTIKKVTVPANSGTDSFPFSSASSGVDPSFRLDTNGPDATYPDQKVFTFSGTGYGSKSVTEGSTTGWALTNVDCGTATNSGSGATATVTVNPGDAITCTYTNKLLPKLTVIKHVVNNNGGGAVASAWSIHVKSGANEVSGSPKNGSETGDTYTLNPGTYVASETGGPSAYTFDGFSGDCAAGTGSVTLAYGDNKTCTLTNNDNPATIVIIKNAKPAQGSFAFDTTGSTSGPGTSWPTGANAFTLTGSTASNGNRRSFTVDAGTYTVKEQTQLSWILTGIGGSGLPAPNQYDCVVSGSGGSTGSGVYQGSLTPLDTRTVSIVIKNGDTVTCTFENTGNGATRTQGFWATHPQLANIAWFGGSEFGHTFPGVALVPQIGDQLLCPNATPPPIAAKDMSTLLVSQPVALGRLMGGFWSDISKTSTAKKRSSIDQARMQLLQQLLAAELNASAFGSLPGSGSFSAWEAAYCGSDLNAIKTAQQQAASFNSQGDNSNFTPGTSADSKGARAIANIPYWDILP